MKRILIAVVLVLVAASAFGQTQIYGAGGQTLVNGRDILSLLSGSTLPSTCSTSMFNTYTSVPNLFVLTSGSVGVYQCTATNTWTLLATTASPTLVTPTITGPMNFSDAVAPPVAPTSGTPTSGGSCTAGAHSWKVTFVTAAGETLPSGKSSPQTCVSSSGQTVPISAIPLGPAGTIARNIYMTKAGDTGSYYLIAASTVADNTTTTYSETTADGSLSAVTAPTASTAGALIETNGSVFAADNGTTLFLSRQLYSTAGAPSIGSNACGSSTQGTITGTDFDGIVTAGTASVTTCTVSFSATYSVAPRSCVLSAANSGGALQATTGAYVSSISTGGFVITGTALASAAWYYHCQ